MWNRITSIVTAVLTAVPFLRAEPPRIAVLDTRVISLDMENYHGGPTLARRANGQLVVVCSGGRETHVCPFGCVDPFVSNDQGTNLEMAPKPARKP